MSRERRPLGADIDLLAPVGLAAGALGGDAVVSAKMRRVDHLDGQLVGFGQREKALCRSHEIAAELGTTSWPADIEKTDVVSGGAQLGQESGALRFRGIEAA